MGTKVFIPLSNDTFDNAKVKILGSGVSTFRDKRYYDAYSYDGNTKTYAYYDFNEVSGLPQDKSQNENHFTSINQTQNQAGVWDGKSILCISNIPNYPTANILPPSGAFEVEFIVKCFSYPVANTFRILLISYSPDQSCYISVRGSDNIRIRDVSDIKDFAAVITDTNWHHIRIKFTPATEGMTNGYYRCYLDNILSTEFKTNKSVLDMQSRRMGIVGFYGNDNRSNIYICLLRVTQGALEDYEINYDLTRTTNYELETSHTIRSSEALDLAGMKIDSITDVTGGTGSIQYLLYEVDENKYYFCDPENSYTVTEVLAGNLNRNHSNTIAEANTYFNDIIQAGHDNIVPTLIYIGDGTTRPEFTSFTITYSIKRITLVINAGADKSVLRGATPAIFNDCEILDEEEDLDRAIITIEETEYIVYRSIYDSLQSAVRDWAGHTFVNAGNVIALLTVYNVLGEYKTDRLNISVIEINQTVKIKLSNRRYNISLPKTIFKTALKNKEFNSKLWRL